MLSSASSPTCDEYFSGGLSEARRPIESSGGHDLKLQSMVYGRLSRRGKVLNEGPGVARVDSGAGRKGRKICLWRCRRSRLRARGTSVHQHMDTRMSEYFPID